MHIWALLGLIFSWMKKWRIGTDEQSEPNNPLDRFLKTPSRGFLRSLGRSFIKSRTSRFLKSPSSRFPCQITARLPLHTVHSPIHLNSGPEPYFTERCTAQGLSDVYCVHVVHPSGASHPVITGPGLPCHLLLAVISPMWDLVTLPPALSGHFPCFISHMWSGNPRLDIFLSWNGNSRIFIRTLFMMMIKVISDEWGRLSMPAFY